MLLARRMCVRLQFQTADFETAPGHRIFAISRKALINDNLDVFADVTRRTGLTRRNFNRTAAGDLIDILSAARLLMHQQTGPGAV